MRDRKNSSKNPQTVSPTRRSQVEVPVWTSYASEETNVDGEHFSTRRDFKAMRKQQSSQWRF